MRRILLLAALLLSIFSNAQTANKTMTNGGGTPGSGSTNATGSSTEVGVTNGELSVSLSGAANYNIPIAVPPGINGVVPQIGLSYNSQSGVGLAGFGWNISGLSSITRIPSTKYHDGVNDPVDFNALDRYAFDGQRLMLKSGTYGIVGSTYQTENYSNIKISLLSNGASDYFKVEYPDGSSACYGFSTDSKVGLLTYALTYWENPQLIRITYTYTQTNNVNYISSIKYGSIGAATSINEINFVYKNRTRNEESYLGGIGVINNKLLSQINVKGNGVGYRNYVLTHDLVSNYERLISITEKNGDNTKSYNPTLFSYGDVCPGNQTEFNSQFTAFDCPTATGFKTVSGDFDGDGNLEYFKEELPLKLYKIDSNYNIQQLSVYNGYSSTSTIKMYSISILNSDLKLETKNALCVLESPSSTDPNNNKIKIFKVDVNNSISLDYEKNVPVSNNFGLNKNFTLIGDFNGDKLTDIVYVNSYVVNNPGVTNFEFINLDRRVTSNYITDTVINNLGTYYGVDPKNLNSAGTFGRTGDINGDGKTDIVVLSNDGIKVFSLNSNNQFVEILNYNYVGANKNINLSDYNGDGKTDILNLYTGQLLISNGISFTIEALPNDFGIPLDTTQRIEKVQFLSVDFNGDGKMDFVKVDPFEIIGDLVSSYSYYDQNYVYTTVNTYNWTHGINMTLYEKIGNGLWSTRYFSKEIQTNTDSSDYVYNMLFFDKSRISPCKTELSFMQLTNQTNNQTYGKLFYVSLDFDLKEIQNLKKITQGNGVSETVTYSNLIDSNNVYTSASQVEFYPNYDIINATGFKVVSQIERTSATVYKKQLYKYYGATSNIEGLGFLGFRSILKTNWFADASQIISNVTNYSISALDTQHNFSFRGAPLESYSVQGLTTFGTPFDPNNPFINWSLYSYNYDGVLDDTISPILSNKVFKIRNTSSQTVDGLLENKVDVSTVFDIYNNPVTKTTTVSNDASGESMTAVENYSYDNLPTASPYFIGRAKSKVITKTIQPSNDTSVDEELYTYNNNLLTQIQKRATNSGVTTGYITETNDYDAYGNIITKTLGATGETPRVSSFQYDTTNRFLTKKTDIQLQATDYTYDLSTGLLLTESPPFTTGSPLTTTYAYDTWGKKISTKNYLGKIETYTYANTTDGLLKTTTGPAGVDNSSILILDDLGRKIHEGTKTIDGNWSYTSTYYDINDKPLIVSQPYFVGVDGLGTFDVWNEMQYDVYGRLIQSNSLKSNDSDGKQTVYSYSGLSSTENDGQKIKVTTKNPYGKVIAVTETPTGIAPTTINYEYFSNGNLKDTKASGADTTIEQDGWGRKITLNDPSAGTYKYTYNNFGETKSEEVVGKGTTTYTLDAYGKVITKTILGTGVDTTNTLTTYVYDPTSKLLTGMTFKDNTNNYTIDYTYGYDSFRRLNLTKESRANFYEFQKEYSFDTYGRAEKEHFLATDKTVATAIKISDKWIKTIFKNGYKYQLYDMTSSTVVGTTKLWQTTTANQHGKVLTATMGNGITVANTYDLYGFPTQIKHDKTTTNIMTLTTDFDHIYCNLKRRTSNLFGIGALLWDETLGYDKFDRLNSYKDAVGIQTQSYASNGTITTNNIGDYAYTISGKPFTLSTITPAYPSAVYDYYASREQNITYNLFKSPVSIAENSNENIDFEYNAQNGRSVMYYGDQTTTKSARIMRKYFSADGSMEIKRNTTTNVVDFVTYIGGDGYTAPVVLKSNGTTKSYYYLHRDYQGSILAITNSTGVVVEKRLFDVWGSLIKYAGSNGVSVTPPTTTTGLFLDRGYTGHEHLLGVGLINMNGRIYDNKLHRFLQPDNNIQDPFNTQNYNRYGYGMNNPTKYTDPSGEFWWIFAAVFAISTYIHGAQATGNPNPLKWNAGQWANAAMAPISSAGSFEISKSFNKYVDNYEANKRVLPDGAVLGEREDHPYVAREDVHADSNYFLNNDNESKSSESDWYDYISKKNFWVSSFSTILEKGSGITRFGTNLKLYKETLNGGVFYGNKSVETFGLTTTGKILGKASFGLGFATDCIGVSIYYNDPSSSNAVHPAKMATNTTFGAIGLWGENPFAATLYFGIDLFYPGGWTGNKNNPGLMMDQDRLYQQNRAINPEWQMFPGAMKQ